MERTALMRTLPTFAFLIAALAPAGTPRAAEEAPSAALQAKARQASRELGQNLKAALKSAIKAGGPVAAIPVCKTAAQSLAEETGRAHGLNVGRTALRLRNPANAPDAWERKVLEDFAAKIAVGTDPATLEHAEIVSGDGGRHYRYMKAIPMAAKPCLACHGEALAPAVKAEIAKAYPNDQATGFKPGELRGAFTVTIKAD